jgi:hypothetical protein
MASLQRKKIKGHYYWYVVESKRVGCFYFMGDREEK